MGEGTFERVTDSDKRLYGPRKLVFCGFPAKARPSVAALLEMAALGEVPTLFAGAELAGETVGALFRMPVSEGSEGDSDLPRAIIVGGISEGELQRFMAGARASRMQPPLWAVLTAVSETWTLSALLRELAAERTALSRSGAPKA